MENEMLINNVGELAQELSQFNKDYYIACYTEDQSQLAPGHLFRVLSIESVSTKDAELVRGDDGIPTFKFGKSPTSRKIVLLEVTADH
jgi:hypothetical protein